MAKQRRELTVSWQLMISSMRPPCDVLVMRGSKPAEMALAPRRTNIDQCGVNDESFEGHTTSRVRNTVAALRHHPESHDHADSAFTASASARLNRSV